VLEVGAYIAIALLIVEMVLVVSLLRGKTTKGTFLVVSPVIVATAAFFWMGNRVTEFTIPKVATIKAAVDLASQYAEDIKNIKTDVERQKQTIDAVAVAARDLADKNEKATAQLGQIKDQLERAQTLTRQLEQQQEYSKVARYDAFGLLGLAGSGLKERSPMNDIFGNYVHNEQTEFRFDCTPEAVSAYTAAIALDKRFPFSYYYRGMCDQLNGVEGWQRDLDTARDIFLITVTIPSHHANHDEVLKMIENKSSVRMHINRSP
jgi:hypothetical protein